MKKKEILAGIEEKQTFTSLGMAKVGIQFKSGQIINFYTASIDFKGWHMVAISRGHEWKFRLNYIKGVWKCDKFAPTIGELLPKSQ